MRIHGLTVSVDYADRLAQTLDRWLPSLTSCTIVSSERDAQTNLLAEIHGCLIHNTDVFWADGAHFAKSRAMEEARQKMPWSDWILFFDADILPPERWMDHVMGAEPGKLYGCRRVLENGQMVREGEIAGFFQLFHSSDPRVQATPLLDTSWRHAGGYDSRFQERWPKEHRVILPMVVQHLGEHQRNWFGVNNTHLMDGLIQGWRRHGHGKVPGERFA